MKLFTGAFMGDKPVVNMDTAIVKAAVDVAHAQGKPVFAHPQNRIGVDNAVGGGVDILAHTVPTENNYTTDELTRFKSQHTALIPTLSLWTTIVPDPVAPPMWCNPASTTQDFLLQWRPHSFRHRRWFHCHLRHFARIRTDASRAVGQPDSRFTHNQSRGYFKTANKGRVEKGLDADLVVLDADPAADVRNLAKVAYTVRAGQIIYQK